jgi:hypothetical protein
VKTYRTTLGIIGFVAIALATPPLAGGTIRHLSRSEAKAMGADKGQTDPRPDKARLNGLVLGLQ